MIKKIILAKPRGYCSGVKRATTLVEMVLEKFGAPLYVRHQIVHNKHVVADFENKGVIFVEDVNQIPDGSRVVISAHGCPPDVYTQAKEKNLQLFDATCPLVTKVHNEVKRYEIEGYFIFYIGHKNHPEPLGVLGEVLSQNIALIETLEEAKNINPPQEEKLMVLSQTTLSLDETKEIIDCLKQRFPNLLQPPGSDICYSTQNRQKAVKALTKEVDIVLVIGSKESSNSNRLKDVARQEGVEAYLIDDISEINPQWLEGKEVIGITAGASVPEHIIDEAINFFQKQGADVNEIESVSESVINFSLPVLTAQ